MISLLDASKRNQMNSKVKKIRSRNNSFPLNFCLFNFLISHDTQEYFCGAFLVFILDFFGFFSVIHTHEKRNEMKNRRSNTTKNTTHKSNTKFKAKNVLGCQTVFLSCSCFWCSLLVSRILFVEKLCFIRHRDDFF